MYLIGGFRDGALGAPSAHRGSQQKGGPTQSKPNETRKADGRRRSRIRFRSRHAARSRFVSYIATKYGDKVLLFWGRKSPARAKREYKNPRDREWDRNSRGACDRGALSPRSPGDFSRRLFSEC